MISKPGGAFRMRRWCGDLLHGENLRHSLVAWIRARHELPRLPSTVFDERTLQRLKAGIFKRVELLGQFPEFGRELPRYGKQWRQLLYHPYRLIYFVEHSLKTVFISRIWHSSRAEPTEEDLIPLH